MRILVIEDNPKLASAISSGLEAHGFTVHAETRGFEGETRAADESFDVIILDVMLPDRDGIEICRNLRRRDVTTPILMLTAIGGTADKVNGLEAGADDYLTKPFDFEELVARVRALLRRGQGTEAAVLEFGDLRMDLRKRTVVRAGTPIKLTAKEFQLLEYLVRNPERVLTRQAIAERVWDIAYEPTSNVIDVYIAALRKKIERDFDYPLIHTIIGAGYRFGAPDEVAADTE